MSGILAGGITKNSIIENVSVIDCNIDGTSSGAGGITGALLEGAQLIKCSVINGNEKVLIE